MLMALIHPQRLVKCITQSPPRRGWQNFGPCSVWFRQTSRYSLSLLDKSDKVQCVKIWVETVEKKKAITFGFVVVPMFCLGKFGKSGAHYFPPSPPFGAMRQFM